MKDGKKSYRKKCALWRFMKKVVNGSTKCEHVCAIFSARNAIRVRREIERRQSKKKGPQRKQTHKHKHTHIQQQTKTVSNSKWMVHFLLLTFVPFVIYDRIIIKNIILSRSAFESDEMKQNRRKKHKAKENSCRQWLAGRWGAHIKSQNNANRCLCYTNKQHQQDKIKHQLQSNKKNKLFL